MATPISCEAENCPNRAKYTVTPFKPKGGSTFDGDNVKATCTIHLPWGLNSTQAKHPLWLVGGVDW